MKHYIAEVAYICLNTFRMRQNGCHFATDIIKSVFLYKNCCILIIISLKFVAKRQYDNINSDNAYLCRQAIIWTNRGLFFLSIYVSLSHDDLNLCHWCVTVCCVCVVCYIVLDLGPTRADDRNRWPQIKSRYYFKPITPLNWYIVGIHKKENDTLF